MPSYIPSVTAQPTQLLALYPGRSIAVVNNAATDSNITTTQQIAIGPAPGSGGRTLVVVNSTNQTATGQYAAQDPTPAGVQATYEPLSGFVIPNGQSLAYNVPYGAGWINFTFTTAPTSGSLIVS